MLKNATTSLVFERNPLDVVNAYVHWPCVRVKQSKHRYTKVSRKDVSVQIVLFSGFSRSWPVNFRNKFLKSGFDILKLDVQF